MREERGQLAGDQTVQGAYTLWGSVAGDVTVVKGGKFYLRGSIYGNLIIENGGRCHIFGNLKGSMTIHAGSKVIHSGLISGDAVNRGGRLYIEDTSSVQGRVKTFDGKTTIAPGAQVVGVARPRA